MENINENKNYQFFKDNFKDIVMNHIGQFALIANMKVQGYYISFEKAYDEAKKMKLSIGEYLIQECVERIDSLYATYYTSYVSNIIGVN